MEEGNGNIWLHHHHGGCHHSGPALGLGIITEISNGNGTEHKLLCRSCRTDLEVLYRAKIQELKHALDLLGKARRHNKKRAKAAAVAA